MKELFAYIFKFDLKNMFITKTTNTFIQIFRYLFVGGIAFLADGGTLFVLNESFKIHYLIATAIAFLVGLIINFILAKAIVFSANNARVNLFWEFVSYGLIGLVGLFLTMVLMYVGVDCLHFQVMITKCIAVIIVLVWNYTARRLIVYK